MIFVLIKFLLNALLFEKSGNECKNPSFLHKAMGIESDQGSTKMHAVLPFYIRGFELKEALEERTSHNFYVKSRCKLPLSSQSAKPNQTNKLQKFCEVTFPYHPRALHPLGIESPTPGWNV